MPTIPRLTKSAVDRLPLPSREERFALYWDETLHGFGLRVGWGGAKTFVLQRKGKRHTIGRFGDLTVEQARDRALKLIVEVIDGQDPKEERRKAEAREVTLEAALATHVDLLRKKKGSPRTIADLLHDVPFYLPTWMKRKLVDLGKADCREMHQHLTDERGPILANRIFRAVRACFNTALKTTALDRLNPCIAVAWNPERRVQTPIPWEALPSWRVKIEELNTVARDCLLLIFLTGLRSTDASTIRWEEVDLGTATLHRPNPKGGRAFTIPIARAVVEILFRRRAENKGRDDGWVFPTRGNDGRWRPVVEKRWGPKGESPHRLRDTYITAAFEVGTPLEVVQVLVNHRPPRGNVTLEYSRPSIEFLRGHVERVAAFLVARMADAHVAAGAV